MCLKDHLTPNPMTVFLDAIDTTDTIDATDPTDTIDAIDATDAMDAIDATDAMDPTDAMDSFPDQFIDLSKDSPLSTSSPFHIPRQR